MRDRLLLCIATCCYYTGLLSFVRWLDRYTGKRLIIVNYHRASRGNLHSHLLYLRRHFRVLFLESALEELYGERDVSVPPLDRRMLLAITFDDGYEDNYTHAFPLAQKLKIPLTIFLITGYIERVGWPDQLVSWAQVQEMNASKCIAFGAHTVHHPVLAQMTNKAELQREVNDVRATLEQHLGHAPRIFAYPHGGPQHIGEQGLQAVQQAGYSWAVTTMPGFNTPESDPHLLRRVSANVQQHWLLIALMTCSLGDAIGRVYRFARSLLKGRLLR